MSMTDPIADMLTRIRNANRNGAEEVRVPASRIKVGLAKILREEGYIKHYKVVRMGPKGKPAPRGREADAGRPLERQSMLHIYLKYGPKKEPVLNGLQRVSKPGRRVYRGADQIRPVRNGLGLGIVSTSQGLVSDRDARDRRLGGEVLCEVW